MRLRNRQLLLLLQTFNDRNLGLLNCRKRVMRSKGKTSHHCDRCASCRRPAKMLDRIQFMEAINDAIHGSLMPAIIELQIMSIQYGIAPRKEETKAMLE